MRSFRGFRAESTVVPGTMALTAVALLPFGFGGGPRWAWTTAATCLALALVVAGLLRLVEACVPERTSTPVGFACAIGCVLVVLAFLQAVPGLPGAHPIWAEVATALASPVAGTWSMRPTGAGPAAGLLSAMLATLWLANTAPPALRERSLGVIAAMAVVAAAYGLLVVAADTGKVLWLDKPDYRQVATGPFVSRNAFAAYLGLGLMAMAGAVEARRRAGAGIWPFYPPGALVLLAGLAATESRGGLVATLTGLTAVAALWASREGRPRAWLAAAAGVGGLTVAMAAWLGPRLTALSEAAARRGDIYAVALDAVAARPWLGHGAGSFAEVFSTRRPVDLDRVVTEAHSVYLHAAVEWGLPATVSMTAVALALGFACMRAARAGSPTGTAAAGALVLVGVHGAVDFAPQLPGVALTVAWLAGAGARVRPTPS